LNGFCLNSVHPFSLAPTPVGDVVNSVALSNGERSYPDPAPVLRESEPDPDEDDIAPRDGGRRSGIIGLEPAPFVARRAGGGGGGAFLLAPCNSSLVVDRRAIGGAGGARAKEDDADIKFRSSSSSATLLTMLAASASTPPL
jgi:hypothetical protein